MRKRRHSAGRRLLVGQPALTLGLRCLSGLVSCGLASGCATTWAITEISLHRPPLEERGEEVLVPLPGVSESLHVALYLGGQPAAAPAQTVTVPPAVQPVTSAPAAPTPPPEPVLECAVRQQGPERAYRTSLRYGHTWKWASGLAFLIEGGLGTLLLLATKKVTYKVEGGLLAADGLVSGILFFAPERSLYEVNEQMNSLQVRADCPEGLVLDLAGQPVPVDASGHLTELGLSQLERHLATSDQPIGLRIGEYGGSFAFDTSERCAFLRRRSLPEADAVCRSVIPGSDLPRWAITVDLQVPLGSLTAPPQP